MFISLSIKKKRYYISKYNDSNRVCLFWLSNMNDLAFVYTQSSTLKILEQNSLYPHVTKLNNSSSISSSSSSKKLQEDADIRLFYHNIEKTISILPVILVIAGTLGNLIALYVLTRKKLRSQSTMLYFASLTVMDTISLYQWYVFLLIKLNSKSIFYHVSFHGITGSFSHLSNPNNF